MSRSTWHRNMDEHELFEDLTDMCGGTDEIHVLANEILTEWNKQDEPVPGSLIEIALRRGW